MHFLHIGKTGGTAIKHALKAVEAAVAEDPDSALAWASLSEAWTALGYSERARETARSAFLRSAVLVAERPFASSFALRKRPNAASSAGLHGTT